MKFLVVAPLDVRHWELAAKKILSSIKTADQARF
jgi:hypothetical protein